jgi:hypothetical protein
MGTQLTQHQIRQLAVAACVDPRTVRKYMAGGPGVSTTTARIEGALIELHWTHLKRVDVHHPMEGIA